MTKLQPKIVINGNEFYAIKPYHNHPSDNHLFVVLRDNSVGNIHEYVVHTYDMNTNTFSNGGYFNDFNNALKSFNDRGHVL